MDIIIKQFNSPQDYLSIWQEMKGFTRSRTAESTDQIWCLEHAPVFTQGQAGGSEHILNPGNIPVIQSDRGGQVTYHGPGQLVIYLMCDLRRLKKGARDMVSLIEHSIISCLSEYGIEANGNDDARGVYVRGAKIASLGLRISRGCSYHGLALNVEMDLEPFQRINPCGYTGMQMTQIADQVSNADVKALNNNVLQQLISRLGYNQQRQVSMEYTGS